MFGKFGRWVAGRVQGSRGVQKYDDWMGRNPWANTALNIAGSVALGAATGGLGSLVGGAAGGAIAGAGRLASRTGMLPGGNYNPSGGGGRSASGGNSEMNDLAERRRRALDRLEAQTNGPAPGLRNDPAAGIQYTPPTAAERNTTLFDQAVSMQRPSGAIRNDAMEELRGRGQYTYRDRPMATMVGDPLEEIRNFRGRAGDIAERYATGGMPGGGSGGQFDMSRYAPAQVGARSVTAKDERASVEELMNFDPSAAFERYMTGAQSRMADTLKQSNEKLTNSAAGRGRLNTGFFDLDAGELGRQIRQDFSNDLSAKALDTNQQKLAAITSGSQIRASDLNSLREQYLSAEQGNQRSELEAALGNQRASMDFAGLMDRAAGRDADFRLGALRELSGADDRRLNALNDARGYLENDRAFNNKNYENDRDFGRDVFNDYNDRLETIGNTQRDDRDFANKNWETDRNWLLDADRQRQDYYQNDRDFIQDRWRDEVDVRFRGGDLARDDREWETRYQNDAMERYLDFLSGNSDRAQGAQNAAAAAAAQRAAGRDQMWGQVLGAGLGIAGDWWSNRRSRTNTGSAFGVRRGNTPAGGNNGNGVIANDRMPFPDVG